MRHIARAAIGFGLGATLLSSSIYKVDPWERAVVFDRLRRTCDTTGEGIHFNIPIVQKPFIYDIRSRQVTLTCSSLPTKDSHSVDLTAHVFFRPDVSHLSHTLQTLGPNNNLKLKLLQICLTTLASAISNLNAAPSTPSSVTPSFAAPASTTLLLRMSSSPMSRMMSGEELHDIQGRRGRVPRPSQAHWRRRVPPIMTDVCSINP